MSCVRGSCRAADGNNVEMSELCLVELGRSAERVFKRKQNLFQAMFFVRLLQALYRFPSFSVTLCLSRVPHCVCRHVAFASRLSWFLGPSLSFLTGLP